MNGIKWLLVYVQNVKHTHATTILCRLAKKKKKICKLWNKYEWIGRDYLQERFSTADRELRFISIVTILWFSMQRSCDDGQILVNRICMNTFCLKSDTAVCFAIHKKRLFANAPEQIENQNHLTEISPGNSHGSLTSCHLLIILSRIVIERTNCQNKNEDKWETEPPREKQLQKEVKSHKNERRFIYYLQPSISVFIFCASNEYQNEIMAESSKMIFMKNEKLNRLLLPFSSYKRAHRVQPIRKKWKFRERRLIVFVSEILMMWSI